MPEQISFEALVPTEMAQRAEYIGTRKAEMPPVTVFVLAGLAGAFIALGAIFATCVAAGSPRTWPFAPEQQVWLI